MNAGERGEFKRLRAGGAVTVFGVRECAAGGCQNEVPHGAKLYCSEACWRKEEGPNEEEKEDAAGTVD
jgi:hypothetical protein